MVTIPIFKNKAAGFGSKSKKRRRDCELNECDNRNESRELINQVEDDQIEYSNKEYDVKSSNTIKINSSFSFAFTFDQLEECP